MHQYQLGGSRPSANSQAASRWARSGLPEFLCAIRESRSTPSCAERCLLNPRFHPQSKNPETRSKKSRNRFKNNQRQFQSSETVSLSFQWGGEVWTRVRPREGFSAFLKIFPRGLYSAFWCPDNRYLLESRSRVPSD